jgi:exosortase/archaeosortase family protein
LALFALFSGFIISFPANWKEKLWFIPLGLLIIYISNLFRIVLLVLIKIHFPGSLNFNHKYTFTVLVYGIIFLLWMIWVNKIVFYKPFSLAKNKNV